MILMNMRALLLTGFGLGHLRPAPGTWGSLPPVALALVMIALGGPLWTIDAALALLGLAFAIACVRFGSWGERRFGRKDASPIVADEVAGQSIALLALPWLAWNEGCWRNVALASVALVIFRLMDIIKPPPARSLQRLEGGWGILIDDLIAGAYAMIATQIVVRWVMPAIWP